MVQMDYYLGFKPCTTMCCIVAVGWKHYIWSFGDYLVFRSVEGLNVPEQVEGV